MDQTVAKPANQSLPSQRVFLNDPEGTGSVGPHCTELLESANHWIKMFDDGFTFKGDRQKELKGVFKLRRLKSLTKLRR